jgi:hypothetical protein
VEQCGEQLLALAADALVSAMPWRNVASGVEVAHLQPVTAEFEQTAGLICIYQPLLIPGLLQTPDYARQVLLVWATEEPADMAEWIANRMNRQTILYDQTKRFEFVIPEAALRWRMGPTATMLGQLDRIGLISTLPNVTIGIIPQVALLRVWHTHGFVIFDNRGESGPHVHLELLGGPSNVADSEGVKRFQDAFARLRGVAVYDQDAREVLRRVAEDLRALDPET